jgi:hypothetical protein
MDTDPSRIELGDEIARSVKGESGSDFVSTVAAVGFDHFGDDRFVHQVRGPGQDFFVFRILPEQGHLLVCVAQVFVKESPHFVVQFHSGPPFFP